MTYHVTAKVFEMKHNEDKINSEDKLPHIIIKRPDVKIIHKLVDELYTQNTVSEQETRALNYKLIDQIILSLKAGNNGLFCDSLNH